MQVGSWKRIDTGRTTYPNALKDKRFGRSSLLWVNAGSSSVLYSVVTKTDTNIITGYATDENLYALLQTTTNPAADSWTKCIDSTFRIPYRGNNVDSVDLFYRQGSYNNFLAGNPKRPNEIYVGGIDVIRSTDGGTTFSNITRGYPAYFSNDRTQHSDQQALGWQSLKRRLETLMAETDERQSRLELLHYQVQELSQLGLDEQDIRSLDQEQSRLVNVERLQQGSHEIYLTLYENDEHSLYAQLGRLSHELGELSGLDARINEWREMLNEAQLILSEAANGLRRYSSELDADPQRLAWVESRLTQIHDLARKHRVPPDELPRCLVALESELQTLENPEFNLQSLRKELDRQETEYRQLANDLHAARLKTANILSNQTTSAMHHLGMEGGKFQITVKMDGNLPWSPNGLDKIEFMVRTNRGQPLKPLAKVASGGELSRISLAIQMVAAKSLTIPTLIFDEVDSGIGGAVAEVIGRQLHALGKNRQVLCVTHLPQVAVQAQQHFQVSKINCKSTSIARIVSLKPQQRVEEIARMLGGLEMTEQTKAHAQEMINRAQSQ